MSAADAPRLRRLFEPVDVAALVWFRVYFGAVMLSEVWRYVANGWIRRYYIEPRFHFTFAGFRWVRPWPGEWMYAHFAVMGLAALGVLVGYRYRLSALVLFVTFAHVFLSEKARYLNHWYLACLLAFLAIFLPAQRAFSLDAARVPGLRARTVPAWTLWLLRFQVGLVYFFGGLAKLNGDWLRGEPLRQWLAARTDFPVFGRWFDTEPAVWFFTLGGLGLDLFAVPLLLWRRTRPLAFAAVVFFHLTNNLLFDIGIFPWLMIGMTALFFAPGWPRALLALGPPPGADELVAAPRALRPRERAIAGALAVWALVQVALPLRHFAYPGPVSWTEEGHNFSWHMKLRDKSGHATFTVTDPATGVSWSVDPSEYLEPRQLSKMSSRPHMLHEFAHFLAREYADRCRGTPQVFVQAMVSLNGRPYQQLIDPDVDLAAQPFSLAPAPWILPLALDLPNP